MIKTIYTLNIGNYAPEITGITFPLFRHYANKIGAEFLVITAPHAARMDQRPVSWPLAIEKFQVLGLANERQDDWSLFFDADAMICPDFFDPTEHVGKETVLHAALDLSTTRFRSDHYFRRAGAFRSPGNWCTIASDWTRDAVWDWPQSLTPDECRANITPIYAESDSPAQITADHLIDDYLVARSEAKHGLKVDTILALCARLGEPPRFLHHCYTDTIEGKVRQMRDVLKMWKLA